MHFPNAFHFIFLLTSLLYGSSSAALPWAIQPDIPPSDPQSMSLNITNTTNTATLTAPSPWAPTPFLFPPYFTPSTLRLEIQSYSPILFTDSQRFTFHFLYQYWTYKIRQNYKLYERLPFEWQYVFQIPDRDPMHDVEVVLWNNSMEKGNAYTWQVVVDVLEMLERMMRETGQGHFMEMTPQISWRGMRTRIYKKMEVRRRVI